jgi:phosphosulfolactate synthase
MRSLGVPSLPARTFPFDPGYDAPTVIAHIAQSGHLMAGLKLSMACWQIASQTEIQRKIDAARSRGVPLVAGGAAFEIAAANGSLPQYLDLCAGLGITCIEAGEGFTDLAVGAREAVELARERDIDVQFELGRKHEGPFDSFRVADLVQQGQEWLDAGAVRLVVEARESAREVGLFDSDGNFRADLADELVAPFGLAQLCFEAPTKPSQFALLDHFGPEVWLSNVRLEEVLRVEIYRRGLHADSYGHPTLCPWAPASMPFGAEAVSGS